MRAISKKRRLVFVSSLVVVVAELVINDAQLLVSPLDAHLYSYVIAAVQPRGEGMTNDLAVGHNYYQRAYKAPYEIGM